MAVAEPDAVNLGLVVGADAALLVDTGSSPEHGRAVRATVAGVTDRPLIGAVVTHWHYDHAFGLAAFADLATIGHESLPDRLGSPRRRRKPPGWGWIRRSWPIRIGSSWWPRRSTWAAAGWRSRTSAADTPTVTWWSW